MAIELYELCGANEALLFSPSVWRSRMALMHKELDYTSVPCRFTEKDKIAFSGQKLLPILKDGDTVVSDSWKIAEYLEEAYPDRPTLFAGPGGKAGIVFFRGFVDTVYGLCAPLAVLPVWSAIGPEDQEYFRETREARLGKSLEDVCGDLQERIEALRSGLSMFRKMLASQPFAGGDAPLYSDHMLFGTLNWVRTVGDYTLFESDDPVNAWMERMLDAYGGHARSAATIRDIA